MVVQLAMFSGIGSAGNRSLWLTDGTAGGTYELTGIAGTSAAGISGGQTSYEPGFTSFNDEVSFSRDRCK